MSTKQKPSNFRASDSALTYCLNLLKTYQLSTDDHKRSIKLRGICFSCHGLIYNILEAHSTLTDPNLIKSRIDLVCRVADLFFLNSSLKQRLRQLYHPRSYPKL